MYQTHSLFSLHSLTGKTITTCAWVETIRDSVGIIFLILRDLSGSIQAVLTKENTALFALGKTLTCESVIEVMGLVKAEPKAPCGIELFITDLKVLSLADAEIPIPVVEKESGEVSVDKRQDWRFLILRRPKESLVLKVRNTMDKAYRDFLTEKGFLEIHTPKLMGSPSESTSELFKLDYFGRPAYLAQSPQLYKQMAMVSGLEKVFEIGKIFRAEESFTVRHATEAMSYDVEMSFVQEITDVSSLLEETLVHMIQMIKEKWGDAIKKEYGKTIEVPQKPFPHIPFSEVKKIVQMRGIVEGDENDLSTAEEKEIGAYVREKFSHSFVFITDYPVSVRPFYHKRKSEKTTKSADLLMNGMEITTLAIREENFELLSKQAHEKSVDPAKMSWYFDFFKYGCPPHGGFGLGGERVLMQLLGLPSIRDAMFLFRGPNRLVP